MYMTSRITLQQPTPSCTWHQGSLYNNQHHHVHDIKDHSTINNTIMYMTSRITLQQPTPSCTWHQGSLYNKQHHHVQDIKDHSLYNKQHHLVHDIADHSTTTNTIVYITMRTTPQTWHCHHLRNMSNNNRTCEYFKWDYFVRHWSHLRSVLSARETAGFLRAADAATPLLQWNESIVSTRYHNQTILIIKVHISLLRGDVLLKIPIYRFFFHFFVIVFII